MVVYYQEPGKQVPGLSLQDATIYLYPNMDGFFRMDVFFVVATIGFAVLALLLAIAIAYAIELLRTLNRVADTVENEADALKGDIDEARTSVKRGGNRLVAFLGFTRKTGKRLLKKKRRSS